MPIYDNITNKMDFNKIINEKVYALVMLTASWCGPCKVIKPIFHKYSNTAKYNHINFIEIDIDRSNEIANEFDLRSVPTFVLFLNGNKHQTIIGSNPKELERIVNCTL